MPNSQDQLKAFQAALTDDPALQASLHAAPDLHAAVVIARDAGFLITEEQLMQLQSDLSDQELAAIAGGDMSQQTATHFLQVIYGGHLPHGSDPSTAPPDS